MIKSKRGQAAGAAILLVIVLGLIIGFIILIPPEERDKLIGEESIDDETSEETGKVLLRESPGRVSYIEDKEIEKVIPSSHIYTTDEPTILAEREYLTIKKSLFSSQEKEIYFELEDLELTDDVLLDFMIEDYQGRLIVLLNENEVFNREISRIKPIKISHSLLEKENTLVFKVSSPGVAFWRTNIYDLKNIQIVADVTDTAAQESKHFFYISSDEAENIKEADLRFSISCLSQKMGTLEVTLNDYSIFSGVPENCEDILHYDLPREIIGSGNNWLSFKTEDGDYELHHVAVKIDLEKPAYPLYTFEIDDNYFDEEGKLKENYDVSLTLEFTSGERKEAEILVNGHELNFDTNKIEFSVDIDNQVESWINSVKIVPQNSFDIKELLIELKKD